MPTENKDPGEAPKSPKSPDAKLTDFSKRDRPSAMTECGAAITTDSMERFLLAFERSARRWEMVVYPAMFAFMLLAGYGFYLIYSLTSDMRVIAQNLDPQMGLHMNRLSSDMEKMTATIAQMAENVHEMTGRITTMANSTTTMAGDTSNMSQKMSYLAAMEPISAQMAMITQAMHAMNVSMDMMRVDIAGMRNATRPMSMFGNMFPF